MFEVPKASNMVQVIDIFGKELNFSGLQFWLIL